MGEVGNGRRFETRLTGHGRAGTVAGPGIIEAVVLPKHDEISLASRVLSAAAVAAAVGLLAWVVYRVAVAPVSLGWWTIPVAVAGVAAADFASGLVHWGADTWGSERMPVIGRRLLHPFRVHHVNPDDFLTRRFLDTNGDVAVLVVAVLAATLAIPLDTLLGAVAVVFVAAFSGVGLLTNQVHQWAHMPRPPVVVRVLQQCGLILGREAHARHHRPPYVANYCIATGWCNSSLAAVRFFPHLERVVTRLTGLHPRQDDTAFAADAKNSLEPSDAA